MFGRKKVDLSSMSTDDDNDRESVEIARKRLNLARERMEPDTPKWAAFGKLGGAHRKDD